MDYQFIDITSYRGISSNAEHWYAKIGTPELTQENLLFGLSEKSNSGVSYVNGEELKYYPNLDEAIEIYKKDNGQKDELNEWDKERIKDILNNGTIRFPSVLSIVLTAKNKFPHSILCFSICGYQQEFARYMLNHGEIAERVCDIILNK